MTDCAALYPPYVAGMAPSLSPRPRPRRLGLYIPWALFALFCAGWSGYWFIAKDTALKALDAAIVRANAVGMDAGYTRVSASGFPLHLTLTIEEARATPMPFVRFESRRLPLSINLSNPRHLIIGLADGVRWTTTDGVAHDLQATKGEMSVRFGADNALARASLDVAGVRVAHGSGLPTEIESLLLHVRPDPRNAADAQLVLETKNWVGPTPFAALNDLAPFDHFNAAVVATESATLASNNPLRTWTGAFRVERFDVGYAQTAVVGEGELKLDAAHRFEGVLHITPAGAQPVDLRATNGWWTFAGLRVAQAKPLYSSD